MWGNWVCYVVFEVVCEELRLEVMEDLFVKLLKEWVGCECVVILMGLYGWFMGDGLEFVVDLFEMKVFSVLCWVMLEWFVWEKFILEWVVLLGVLEKYVFGVIVVSIGLLFVLVVGLSVLFLWWLYMYLEVGVLL